MTREAWDQISYKYLSIDHGETPQVFRAATEEEITLMRAAPDLLAACGETDEACRLLYDEDGDRVTMRRSDFDAICAAASSARAAIAKARGEGK